MSNKELVGLIEEYQHHEMKNFPVIYGDFEKLLQMYGSRIGDCEAVQDLCDFFVELLFNIDLSKFEKDELDSLNRYIAVCIRNEYYLMLKRKPQYLYLSDELMRLIPAETAPFEEDLFLKQCLSVVSETQRTILTLRYCNDFSDAEIAEILHISRQAVNKNRKKGLETIRKFLA